MLNKKALAGTPSTPPAFVEDVFSINLWDGNSTARSIVNGIDLATKGGLVWAKYRNATASNRLYDTNRGATKQIFSDLTNAEQVAAQSLTSFNADGFSLGTGQPNETTATVVGWTFRKQAKFFDVVTYTGNGANRTIAHNLGSVPGMIIVKRTDTTGDWQVYHRANTANPETDYLVLNTTAATADSDTRWNDTQPTSSVFSLGTEATVNANTGTYVAYLFAHDAGGFGTAGTDNVISCGSFTTDGSGLATVNLGYEPQWILHKRDEAGESWRIADNMRGWQSDGTFQRLQPNTSGAEANTPTNLGITATGFETFGNAGASATFIYMAIRRPMKVPTTGTSVFSPNARTGNGSTQTVSGLSFSPDLWMTKNRGNTQNNWAFDRLRGPNQPLSSNLTDDEATNTSTWFGGTPIFTPTNTGFTTIAQSQVNTSSGSYIDWLFKRAPGFFDVVCYTGTGSALTVNHNLGVVPELMIFKTRSGATRNWGVYAASVGTLKKLWLNATNAVQNDSFFVTSTPTSTVLNQGIADETNESGNTYVAYLFATLAGVSKVGSYTGTAAAQTINCGFTGGARFVLIKRTDSTGDWYVWDTARGIVSGDDPYLLLNSTAAEVTNTDYVDPVSSGFELSSTAPAAINASGGTFIFLAIA